MRICVIRGGGIGDFVVTLPAMAMLRRHWPAAHIEVLGYPRIAELAVAAGIADSVTSLDRAEFARFFGLRPTLTETQRDFVRSFDLIVSYLYDPDAVLRTNLAEAGARHVVYGNPQLETAHAVDHFIGVLAQLALYPDAPRDACPRIRLTDRHLLNGRRILKEHGIRHHWIAIHPGSGSPKKNWPIERFLRIAGALHERTGLPVGFLLGEADATAGTALADSTGVFPVLSGLSLVDVAAVFSACALYLGNDSGITHIAAACGRPVLALFGPTRASQWAPRGETVTVLAPPGTARDMAAISEDRVLSAAQRILPEHRGRKPPPLS